MNQPTNSSSSNNNNNKASGAGDTSNGATGTRAYSLGAGGVAKAPGIVRKSNPCDLLKNLKSVDKKQVKKPTILEQAAQDWNKCKVEENLEDELKQATKSKTGYLDKQSFLERSDLRQFEKEREIRDRTRARTTPLNRGS